jgi:hypothetical protein
MEDGKGPYIHEEKVRGMNINVEEIEYNGNIKRMESFLV